MLVIVRVVLFIISGNVYQFIIPCVVLLGVLQTYYKNEGMSWSIGKISVIDDYAN